MGEPIKITLPTVFEGPSSLRVLPELVAEHRVLLLVSRSFLSAHEFTTIRTLNEAAKTLSTLTDIPSNPDVESLSALFQAHKLVEFDIILAIGGGSVIDAAKILSFMFSCRMDGMADLLSYLRDPTGSNNFKPSRTQAIIAVPTTSGTGSEATQFATLWDKINGEKFSLDHPSILPLTVILDAELVRNLPANLVLTTGLDALSHALESLWNNRRTPISICSARGSAETLIHALPRTLANPNDLGPRQSCLSASFFAGCSINTTRTAVAHAVSYPMTLECAVPHGLAASYLLPGLIHHLIDLDPEPSLEPEFLLRVCIALQKLPFLASFSRFANLEQLIRLIPRMQNPARFKNFIHPIHENQISLLLNDSWEFWNGKVVR